MADAPKTDPLAAIRNQQAALAAATGASAPADPHNKVTAEPKSAPSLAAKEIAKLMLQNPKSMLELAGPGGRLLSAENTVDGLNQEQAARRVQAVLEEFNDNKAYDDPKSRLLLRNGRGTALRTDMPEMSRQDIVAMENLFKFEAETAAKAKAAAEKAEKDAAAAAARHAQSDADRMKYESRMLRYPPDVPPAAPKAAEPAASAPAAPKAEKLRADPPDEAKLAHDQAIYRNELARRVKTPAAAPEAAPPASAPAAAHLPGVPASPAEIGKVVEAVQRDMAASDAKSGRRVSGVVTEAPAVAAPAASTKPVETKPVVAKPAAAKPTLRSESGDKFDPAVAATQRFLIAYGEKNERNHGPREENYHLRNFEITGHRNDDFNSSLRTFQEQHRLPVTGKIDKDTIKEMQRIAQDAGGKLGAGGVNGVMDDMTIRAIGSFDTLAGNFDKLAKGKAVDADPLGTFINNLPKAGADNPAISGLDKLSAGASSLAGDIGKGVSDTASRIGVEAGNKLRGLFKPQ